MRALLPLVSLSCILAAQPAGPAKRLARLEAQGEDGPLARQLLMVRVRQLKETMGLNDPQATAIAERWAAHDREIVQSTRQLNQVRGQFREILLGPGSEDEKSVRLKPLMDQFLDLRRRQMDSRSRFESEIRTGLSTAQQARLIMLVEEITRRIQEGLANRPGLLRRQDR